jgi:ATP-binding cassette subfamily B protein
LWYGFKLVNDQAITLGALTAFQSYVFQIGAGLGHTSTFIAQLVQARGVSGRIFYLLDRIPEIPKPRGKKDPSDEEKGTHTSTETPPDATEGEKAAMLGLVEFRGVNFSYPSRSNVPVLRDFNLVVPPNTTAAIVGSSGAGKSTVVALLERFYDVNAGSIMIDGKDIRDLDLKWLRSHTASVQQEPVLFGITCRENVMYGVDRDVSQAELEEVCRKASAHDFIKEWPEGYDTLVGERGVKLSGGQKQRLSIARALLVNPRILLLDEATSALDAESEHLVQEAIQKAVVGRTVLIVAHRLSTIQNADQIVVLDNCQIVDVGRHEELLERCNKYQDLIKRQSLVGKMPSTVDLSQK